MRAASRLTPVQTTTHRMKHHSIMSELPLFLPAPTMVVFHGHCSWGRWGLQALCRSSQGHPTSSTIRPSDAGPTNLCRQWRHQLPTTAALPPAISPCRCSRPTSPSLVSKRSTDLRVPMEARTRWTLQNSLTRSAALIMASTTTLFCLQTTQIELLLLILLVQM
jgi:hypothetical protein